MSDSYVLQANLKIGDSRNGGSEVMINVRGDTPEEWSYNLDYVTEKADQVRAAERALLGLAPDGLQLIEQELGGRVVQEFDSPPAAQPQFQNTYCDRCKDAPTCKTCGRAAVIPAKSVKNGQWYIHECPSGDRDHKGQWCNPPK